MASLQGTSPGSLAEHDIIISISQEAINRQFQLLYNKPIRSGANKLLPPPPGLKLKNSGFVTPPSKFLINHELRICGLNTNVKTKKTTLDEESGIFGHIKCPTISLQASANTGRVEFEFERVADAKTPDSLFKSWEGPGKSPELEEAIINGWKMSWEVNLSKHTFGDFEKDLTKPAADPYTPEVAHPDTIKALNAVSSDHFTVSSIFCMFEDALTVNTFQLRDEKGEVRGSAGKFINLVTAYFTELQATTVKGTATADHPFVLGYGLAQKVPNLQSIDPKLQTDKTPLYFIPHSYQVTTSPGYVFEGTTAQKRESQYSKGCLNFCMTTFRDPKDPARAEPRVNRSRNPSAGIFAMSPFDLTKTKDHDGLMGIARDLIFDRYLANQIADAYYIDPSTLINTEVDGKQTSMRLSGKGGGSKLIPSPLAFERQGWFTYKGVASKLIQDDHISFDVTSTLTLTWDSELQRNPATIAQKDALRQAYITAINDIKVNYQYTDTGVFKDNNYKSHIDVRCKYVFAVASGKGGAISITLDRARSIMPAIKDGRLDIKQGKRGPNDFGAYFTADSDANEAWEFFKSLLTQGNSSMMNLMLQRLQGRITGSITGKIKDQLELISTRNFEGLSHRVIMPAGNVFNFAGVDVDSQGNMFAHISFALGAENVTTTAGGKPTELGGKAATQGKK